VFEIRFYYKNDDRHSKNIVSFHTYNSFNSYGAAYEELIYLVDLYEEIGVNEVLFSPSIPNEVLQKYVLFLHSKGKDLVTIIKR